MRKNIIVICAVLVCCNLGLIAIKHNKKQQTRPVIATIDSQIDTAKTTTWKDSWEKSRD